jgi:RHH-type proline utilization regulon transcriptional repressor/proline dehydrogenase/delta 1-pyrroline-5-carboxylate dehydrogenase
MFPRPDQNPSSPQLAAPDVIAVADLATHLIHGIRAQGSRWGGFDDFLRHYSLRTEEGIALMGMAEALLRVPDAATADKLLEDKLAHLAHDSGQGGGPMLVFGASWALALSARVVKADQAPATLLRNMVRRIGLPAVRRAVGQAVHMMGNHFVLGQTIEEALANARPEQKKGLLYSYDMLGEGARTAQDAHVYFDDYAHAIAVVGAQAQRKESHIRPGISVKLSALHPRYEAVQRERVLHELCPRLLDLARAAKTYDLNLTVDAEEADRLELSLEVFETVLADSSLEGWDGFGLAVQAYQTRAGDTISHVAELARRFDRKLMVRLVKGAYWDTEIKRAQERGLTSYPVFLSKPETDISYLECARKLLDEPRLYPQFATHNALTVAEIFLMTTAGQAYEFQHLHGMGESLYATFRERFPDIPCRVYAPVGNHRDLLAYLVRRLLENSANTSFVAAVHDKTVPVEELVRSPYHLLAEAKAEQKLRLPRDMYQPSRQSSQGIDFGMRAELENLQTQVQMHLLAARAAPLINGHMMSGVARAVLNPADARTPVGMAVESDGALVDAAMSAARAGIASWRDTPLDARAACLERAAGALEDNKARFIGLLQAEAGKTLDDAIAEVREAVDFCRYYAVQARTSLTPLQLAGPTGERNVLELQGRGVFVCISPWNFPLSIFLGQIVAALVAGNTVVAKPAGQTPLIAFEAVQLLHRAGIPVGALHLLPGGRETGEKLVVHTQVAGVVFTGSTASARAINQALAAKKGPIVPLIAETGGINAMIVDATALPEQVVDDVLSSAFRSAGQRCSALRLLCVQKDMFAPVMKMLTGALQERTVGDPQVLSTDIGPVIDAHAKERLLQHIGFLRRENAIIYAGGEMPAHGYFVAPHIARLECVSELKEEIFGPVLHVLSWEAGDLDRLLDEINHLGYGLTLGIHSRINTRIDAIVTRMAVGNIYINRNMIGAVVGTQPFGGMGLSGTGPKAGGPHYLHRFCTERVITTNTAAVGGNTDLMMQ